MHYWNEESFRGLRELGAALRGEELEALADYCELREQGLRKEAFVQLRRFLSEAKGYSAEAARKVCCSILELQARVPEAHQFLSKPLLDDFLIPTLKSWHSGASSDPTPLRWLGLLLSDVSMLEEALNLNPADRPVRSTLVSFALDDVYQATHHLGEGHFIGSIEEAENSLRKATALVDLAPEPDSFESYRREIEYFGNMLRDWIEFSRNPSGSFPEWCKHRGVEYHWPVIVYYE